MKQLGIPMATAIDMYLRQISLTGGISIAASPPKVPAALNADNVTAVELHAALKAGYDDIKAGNVRDASSPFPLLGTVINETVPGKDYRKSAGRYGGDL